MDHKNIRNRHLNENQLNKQHYRSDNTLTMNQQMQKLTLLLTV